MDLVLTWMYKGGLKVHTGAGNTGTYNQFNFVYADVTESVIILAE